MDLQENSPSTTTSSMAMGMDIKALNEKIQQESSFIDLITMEINKVIVGQKHLTESLLVGLLADAIGKAIKGSNNGGSLSVADELKKMKGLVDDGILSQEEFDEQKTKLLNK